MKKLILGTSTDAIFGMANINPNRSGLSPIVIWFDHNGVSRNVPHSEPRIKIGVNDWLWDLTIEETPKILAKKPHIKKSIERKLKEAAQYIGRNYDLFLKHYNDTDFSFDDEALYQALRERGEYK